MRNVFIQALNESFDLTIMLGKINYHHIRGNLTDREREELITLAREKANPDGGLDVPAKLREFDERIIALEKLHAESDESVEGGEVDTIVAEYTPGKWYYAGDKVMHNGAVYECIAPEGVVCTWSPTDYPAYWQTA